MNDNVNKIIIFLITVAVSSWISVFVAERTVKDILEKHPSRTNQVFSITNTVVSTNFFTLTNNVFHTNVVEKGPFDNLKLEPGIPFLKSTNDVVSTDIKLSTNGPSKLRKIAGEFNNLIDEINHRK